MSRKKRSRKQRQAREKARHEELLARLRNDSRPKVPHLRNVSLTFRGGVSLDLVFLPIAVPYDPDKGPPADLKDQVMEALTTKTRGDA